MKEAGFFVFIAILAENRIENVIWGFTVKHQEH